MKWNSISTLGSRLTKEAFEKLYIVEKHELAEIAQKYGVPFSAIIRLKHKYEIPTVQFQNTRPKSPKQKETQSSFSDLAEIVNSLRSSVPLIKKREPPVAVSPQPPPDNFLVRDTISCKFCANPTAPTEPFCLSCLKRQPLEWRITSQEFQFLYLRQGYTCEQIAERYKSSAIYIQKLKNHYRILTKSQKRRGTTENFGRRLNGRLTREDFERLYYSEKKNLEEIGSLYGVTRQTISKYAKSYGIKTRTRADDYGLIINEKFFGRWSDEMAWVLGLIITDGSIDDGASGDRLSFSSTDRVLTENILKAMQSNHPIKEKKPHGFSKKMQYCTTIGNQKIAQDLNALGVTRKKSLIVRYPPVPSEHFRHFLRGVFEGDGSMHVTNRTVSGEPIYRVTVVSGSKDFIEGLQHAIAQHFGITGQLHRTLLKSKKEFFQLVWCITEDVHKLGELMYQNVDESLLLPRKRDIFKEFETTQYQRFLERAKLKGATATS